MINNYFRLQVMKCTNCGKEFGQGKNCQNCGVDRVTGLGNYNGYSTPSKKKTLKKPSNQEIKKISVHNDTPHQKEMFIICYACNEAIPSNSKYCPMCGKELYVTCPKCGFLFSSQYRFCSQCGTNCQDYLNKQVAKKMKRIKEKEEMLQRIREVDRIQKERKKRKEKSLKK